MLRFVAQKVQKSRRCAMIVCLATRIFEGRRGWGRLHPAACWRQWPLRHSAPDKSYSLCGRISRVPFNPDVPLPAFAPDHATASPNYQGSITIFASPIAAALGVRRAYRSGVSVFEADIADQRSSKLAAGRSFASTVRPFDIVVPAETTVPSGECDLMVAAVAATASRATAANPVIVRCLVIRTSCGPERPLVISHRNFAKVQQQYDKYGCVESRQRS